MIRYIDMYRDHFGVGSICRVLGATGRGFLTSRGYRAAKARPVSGRSRWDAALNPVVKDLHQVNMGSMGCAKCGEYPGCLEPPIGAKRSR